MSAELHRERRGALGILILDRPRALNALTRPMVQAMSRALLDWRDDPGVGAVLVKAVPGRAFCAGGDVRTVTDLARSKGADAAMPFFHDEYRLNWRIGSYPKPYIALIDGITMGGGVGISVHGSHRIATERTLFAMPETGIGFVPDVGGGHFLPRLPGETGTWLGLAGARLGPADCLALGIATHHLPAERLELLEQRLAALPADGIAAVLPDLLAGLATDPGPAPVEALRPLIDQCYEGGDLTAILDRLAAEPSGFGAGQLALLAEKSPLALAVTLAQLRRGRELDLAGALRLEYRIVRHTLAHGDFVEGVRALLVDKDKAPRWRHGRPGDVTADEVSAMMAPLATGDLPLDWEDA